MLPSFHRFDDGEREALLRLSAIGEEFTYEEMTLLRILRSRRRQNLEMFSDRELARLRFVRWLVQTGRVSC